MPIPTEVNQWLQEKLDQHRWSGVLAPRRVTHEWCLRTGGRVMRAGLTASIAPADRFSVSFPLDAESATYLAAVRNGMFSVLLGREVKPILRCAVVFESFVIHDLESSYTAFFRVAKEATEQLLGLAAGHRHNIDW